MPACAIKIVFEFLTRKRKYPESGEAASSTSTSKAVTRATNKKLCLENERDTSENASVDDNSDSLWCRLPMVR